MKVRDYITANLELWSVDLSDSLIDAELINVGLNGDSEYNSESEVKTKTLFYNIIPKLLLRPKSVSEGGYSITYDSEGIKSYYDILCQELEFPNVLLKNKIRDRSNLW
ncbi:DUF6706 family protein [Chryseobacterium sp. MHB01]|uniref:DUF6706 family protein n=1 Tax=Chryseobacterium sp. MHB01 TaxID=3109433 RepID=UPI002AFF7203|nr:DUF6706 family protein [Chryseobacterium sp. MHB01]MEA1849189.1 DUF6706 family protein [Chryseobacterium sp. MHB01]